MDDAGEARFAITINAMSAPDQRNIEQVAAALAHAMPDEGIEIPG